MMMNEVSAKLIEIGFDLDAKRKSGKKGVSKWDVRYCQSKVRLTKPEEEITKALAEISGLPPATLMASSHLIVMQMMLAANRPALELAVKRLKEQHIPLPEIIQQLM
ncbi:hypothetical protein O1D18_001127 [Vibrio cholerae]|uniref:hypothetical protein n=1 Tax=Vibrio TaxID=662 RepID=UPI0020948087|nr:hypothetical protein [Vibrio paracholerae]EKF9797572.1 hypothetical protein [Vibrio cholerae]MCO7065235.1 hypothetical protein [Vibrio paracholerae]